MTMGTNCMCGAEIEGTWEIFSSDGGATWHNDFSEICANCFPKMQEQMAPELILFGQVHDGKRADAICLELDKLGQNGKMICRSCEKLVDKMWYLYLKDGKWDYAQSVYCLECIPTDEDGNGPYCYSTAKGARNHAADLNRALQRWLDGCE